MNRDRQFIAEQMKAPLPEAMQAYAGDGALAFHTPGHKQGLGAHPLLRKLITEEGLRQEVSLMEELDDLHEPTMCIREAQELAAALYGSDAAYFMINGTTGAIHVMLMAALSPGDTVLVPRNAHRSIVGGIILAGARPVYMQPAVHERLGIAMGMPLSVVAAAIREHPEARAVFLVSPTYYGVASELADIAALAHANDMLLLVDEAHGPHLRFSSRLPQQAMDAGADMAAQSTHKILGSLTQTSMLHVRYGRVDQDRVRAAAALLQSTSPNYLLLASLDIARLQMAERGTELVGRAVDLSVELRQRINEIPGLWCFGEELMGTPGAAALDLTKLTVQVRGIGLSGLEAEQILRHTYKIQCELSDAYNLLFIISFADTGREAERLLAALRALADRQPVPGRVADLMLPAIPPAAMEPRQAFFAPARSVAFSVAENRICAETITFYPPGIPVVCPGELLTAELLDYIRDMQQRGLRVVGPEDVSLQTIKVIEGNRV